MTGIQYGAMVVGPLIALIGALIVWKRRPFSAEARRHREEMGIHVGPHTQSPGFIGAGGIFFVCFGLFVLVAGITGLIS
jgi:ABC-type Mn2+/Zn2+ transport system permease subunit